MNKTKSFFEKLTGYKHQREDDSFNDDQTTEETLDQNNFPVASEEEWEEDGQLTVDMFQTPAEIIIQAMVAGVKQENLEVSITQDMITIKGNRQKIKESSEDNYYYKELYWGGFSRSILLPQEIDSENSEATIKNGMLTIKMPKIDKNKIQKIKVQNE